MLCLTFASDRPTNLVHICMWVKANRFLLNPHFRLIGWWDRKWRRLSWLNTRWHSSGLPSLHFRKWVPEWFSSKVEVLPIQCGFGLWCRCYYHPCPLRRCRLRIDRLRRSFSWRWQRHIGLCSHRRSRFFCECCRRPSALLRSTGEPLWCTTTGHGGSPDCHHLLLLRCDLIWRWLSWATSLMSCWGPASANSSLDITSCFLGAVTSFSRACSFAACAAATRGSTSSTGFPTDCFAITWRIWV